MRDRLGLNKLFYHVNRDTPALIASSSYHELAGVARDSSEIRSVPPGHIARVDAHTCEVRLHCYYDLSDPDTQLQGNFDPDGFRARVGGRMSEFFDLLSKRFTDTRFAVCLSGGLDSALIAAFARIHLANVVAATFSYPNLSDDYRSASAIAERLGIEFVPIVAERKLDLAELDAVLLSCQDWRDFNVHCAWVNNALARSLRARFGNENVVVLTGDLMNEYVADYTPVTYGEATYYALPRLNRDRMRRFLVYGLDTSDREIGVFNRFGLTTIQPFSLVAEEYLTVPVSVLERTDCKEYLNLPLIKPASIHDLVVKTKTRAQVGGKDGGTLALFHDSGVTQAVLKERWDNLCRDFGANAGSEALIVAGRYRS